jgi:hypothetical protein
METVPAARQKRRDEISSDLRNGERGEFFRSHPSGKNKDAARMGHPEFSAGMGWPGCFAGIGWPELLRVDAIACRIGEDMRIRRFVPG